MDCPKCGYPRAQYKVSRKKYWGGRKGTEAPVPRTNKEAFCAKCGYKWKEEDTIEIQQETEA